jgi:amino acid transporter
MSKLYPESGGAFVYVKNIFGRFAGFIIGMMTWILGVVTLATEVAALLTAVQMIAPDINAKFIGTLILLALAIVSFFGASILSKLDNVTSLVKILIVLVFVVTCAWLVRGVNFTLPQHTQSLHPVQGFIAAYGTIFFFYTGFSFLPVNADKVQNPSRTLPRMLTWVILTCTSIYLIVQAVTIGALGTALPQSTVPAATAFSHVVGAIGIPLIIVSICISIFGVTVAATFNTPTILVSLANEHEDVPMIVTKNNRFGAPALAVFLTFAGAIVLYLSGNYIFLSGLTVFMSFSQYLFTGFANIKKKFLFIGFGTVIFSLVLLFSFTLQVLIVGFSIVFALGLIYLVSQKIAEKEG